MCNCKGKAKENKPEVYVANKDQLLWCYYSILNPQRLSDEDFLRANTIYKSVFNEDLDRSCGSCNQIKFNKLNYYLTEGLSIQL